MMTPVHFDSLIILLLLYICVAVLLKGCKLIVLLAEICLQASCYLINRILPLVSYRKDQDKRLKRFLYI